MKILTLGREATGKTVFISMLTDYLTGKNSDLNIHVDGLEIAKTLDSNLQTLKKGEWPNKHNQGQPQKMLTFNLGKVNGRKIHFWDFPGEHFKKSVLDPTAPDPDGHLKKLRETIDDAHILIYLLDLGGFLNENDEMVENTWLFREFLTNKKWKSRKRIVVLSKSDLYSGLIEAADGDVKQVIIDNWPDGIVACPMTMESHAKVGFFAVSSIEVKSKKVNGVNQWMPDSPLKSEGMEVLAEKILDGMKGAWWTATRNTARSLTKKSGEAVVVTGCWAASKLSRKK